MKKFWVEYKELIYFYLAFNGTFLFWNHSNLLISLSVPLVSLYLILLLFIA